MTRPSPGASAAIPIATALQQVLAAQHAAVYGYPVIGVALADDRQLGRARSLEAAHRLSRDQLGGQLVALNANPVAAAASYLPDVPVTDVASAQRWAVQLEAACAAAYRYLLASTADTSSPGVRQQALAGLAEAARTATSWRALLSPDRPTVPFPGL